MNLYFMHLTISISNVTFHSERKRLKGRIEKYSMETDSAVGEVAGSRGGALPPSLVSAILLSSLDGSQAQLCHSSDFSAFCLI